MDAPGTPRTSTGVIHFVLAFVAFLSIAGAAIWLGAILPNVTRWHSLGLGATVLGYAITACLATSGLNCRSAASVSSTTSHASFTR
jgi:hypothetical protein